MKITILTVSENKFPYLKSGEKLYIERLSHYTDLTLRSLALSRQMKNRSPEQMMKAESERFRALTEGAMVCSLDRQGKMLDSESFAHQIQMWQNRSVSKLAFCIGGPFGLDPEFIRQSDFVLSLSSMTFPHDMVRLLFLEQLYRAFTILNGEKYHK
jgi:23S rRNA (pseudouridine1915-N3)-methyltransferase